MPIYEYYCADCGQDYNVMRPVSQSDAPANCATCGKPGERQLSNFAFKSNTFTAPKFKASLEKPLRARDSQPAKDAD
ncbi:MAG: zinc ribbon domain-containing protein [SAR202 cluster bacterium]|nr:zinc ribbon domain-containing protein [SAR202 cluster bacterium]